MLNVSESSTAGRAAATPHSMKKMPTGPSNPGQKTPTMRPTTGMMTLPLTMRLTLTMTPSTTAKRMNLENTMTCPKILKSWPKSMTTPMPPTWMPGKDSSSSSWLVATCRSSPSLMARTLRPPLDPLHLRRAPARTKERARAKAKEKERMWCAIHPPQVERLIQKVVQRQLHAFVVANQVIGQRNVHKVRNHPHRPTRDLHPLRVWPCRMRPPWSCSRMRWAPTDRMPPCLTQVHLPSCADMVHSAAI